MYGGAGGRGSGEGEYVCKQSDLKHCRCLVIYLCCAMLEGREEREGGEEGGLGF